MIMAGTDAQSVYADLRGQILPGALPPDTPLRETALAEQFGVSRTPVREALRRLPPPLRGDDALTSCR